MRIRYISDDFENNSKKSLSYLFIESILSHNILSETGTNRLNSLVKAAISKLQNFATPGVASDVDTMLRFIAPKGGGLLKVRELVGQAKELTEPLTQNNDWWQKIFAVFGVQDEATKQSILQKLAQATGSQTQSQPPTQSQSASPTSTDQQQQTQDAQLLSLIEKNKQDQADSMARIKDLQTQIANLKNQQKSQIGESIFNQLASELLNEADVKSNLKFVASSTMRKLGYPYIRQLAEVDWLSKFINNLNTPVVEGFQDIFRNLRHQIANPGYAAQKADDSALRNQNERTAKLAVQLLADNLTKEMTARLQVANLTMPDVIKTVNTLHQLQNEYQKIKDSGRQPTPEFRLRVQECNDMLLRITYAMNPSLAQA